MVQKKKKQNYYKVGSATTRYNSFYTSLGKTAPEFDIRISEFRYSTQGETREQCVRTCSEITVYFLPPVPIAPRNNIICTAVSAGCGLINVCCDRWPDARQSAPKSISRRRYKYNATQNSNNGYPVFQYLPSWRHLNSPSVWYFHRLLMEAVRSSI